MIVSQRHKFIFIATPRTATHAIRDANPLWDAHG